MENNKRTKPLAPDERRRAIIEAVLPLLVERGAAVTTREMAAAAGVAEGTLFSVFPDKRALILAAIEHRLDPEPLRAGLQAIEPEASLEAKLTEAARVIMEHSKGVAALFAVLRILPPASDPSAAPPTFITGWGEAVTSGVTALLEPHRAHLRLEHGRVAATFVALLFTSRHPLAKPRERLTAAEIVDLLLKGTLVPDSRVASASARDRSAGAGATDRKEPLCS